MKLKKKQKIFVNKFWKNRSNKQRSFTVVVILPTLIAFVYYYFIASNKFVVEARFSIKGSEMQQVDILSGIVGVPSQGGSGTDSYIVQDYIQSLDMLKEVNKELALTDIFNHPEADWISALGRNKAQEEILAYWNKLVTASYDPTTTIVTLKVRAFSPEDAIQLANKILKQSEQLVNHLSEKSRRDDLAFAEAEVIRAEKRVANARLRLNDFRLEAQNLDPTQTASAKMILIGELEAQLANEQAALHELNSYMNTQAPSVITRKNKVQALKSQIQREKSTISRQTDTNLALSDLFAEYEPLIAERTFAEKAYNSSLLSLEAARMKASKKQRYLATFVEPVLPDRATEPRRGRSVLTVFFASLVAWAIGLLGVGIIREHVGWV